MGDLDWSGWVQKKAFKSLEKQSWKRRWLYLDGDALTLSWYAAPPPAAGSGGAAARPPPPKGTFAMDVLKVEAAASTDNKRPNELKVQSNNMALYLCTESAAERGELLRRLNAARRRRVCGDDGTALILSEAAGSALGGGGGRGSKVFTWGIGAMLGNGRQDTQAWGQPQLVNALSSDALEITAGPEHCGALDDERAAHLWGSNEFRQTGSAGESSSVFTPLRLARLLPRKVLSLACGGSHTLAIVSESGEADAGGVAVVWGTGTVGQLGLGPGGGRSDKETAEPLVVPLLDAETGAALLARRVAAGVVSSGVVTVTGDVFVWGDASLGRLGLDGVPEAALAGGGGGGGRGASAGGGALQLVNAHIEWLPRRVHFDGTVLGATLAAAPRIAALDIAMGGACTLFLLGCGGGGDATAGGVLAVAGSLGVDITRDRYGYGEELPVAAVEELLDREARAVPRAMTPTLAAPFRGEPCVYAIAAGVRHAAVVAALDARTLRVYTAGKGWLGHGAGAGAGAAAGDGAAPLLPRPAVATSFAAVGGALTGVAVAGVACGHSHTIVLTADSRLFSWGRGDSGELGQGNLSDCSAPRQTRGAEGHHWASIAAGNYYSLALAAPGAPPAVSPRDIVDGYAAHFASVGELQAAAVAAAAAGGYEEGGGEGGEGGGDGGGEEAPLPEGWSHDHDEEGNIYFFAPDGTSTYDDPR